MKGSVRGKVSVRVNVTRGASVRVTEKVSEGLM